MKMSRRFNCFLLYVLIIYFVFVMWVDGYASMLPCSRPLIVDTVIMSKRTVLSKEMEIEISRNDHVLKFDNNQLEYYRPGEYLTVRLIENKLEERINSMKATTSTKSKQRQSMQSILQSDYGYFNIGDNVCNNRIRGPEARIKMPTLDEENGTHNTVNIWGGWTNLYDTVKITYNKTLTITLENVLDL